MDKLLVRLTSMAINGAACYACFVLADQQTNLIGQLAFGFVGVMEALNCIRLIWKPVQGFSGTKVV